MMWRHWAKTIQARCSSRAARLALALLAAASLSASPLETAARAFQQKRTPATRAALARFAAAHPKDRDGALALLSLAAGDQEAGQSAEALASLGRLRGRAPQLSDFAAYYTGLALYGSGDFAGAFQQMETVLGASPVSPMAPEAALIAARAYKEVGRPAEAVRVLRTCYAQLPQPAGDLLLADSYHASNDFTSACIYFQRVYYQYPATTEAVDAASSLSDLRRTLGDLYPAPMTQAMFQRAAAWTAVRDYARAREEYEGIVQQTAGADRETARVRLAALDYYRYEPAAAYQNLDSLEVSSAEADAERLCFMAESARRLDRDDQLQDAVARLGRLYPRSKFRLRALLTAANRYLVENRPDLHEPLYRACYESFPNDPQAPYCHWKVAWRKYIERRPDAAEALRAQVERYPGSDQAPSALYFLGRLAESASRPAEAKAYYAGITTRFPNYFYADLASKRLLEPAIAAAPQAPAVRDALNKAAWPDRPRPGSFEPTPASRARIERAGLLASAGLDTLAEREMRFGARNGGQAEILAMKLAKTPAYNAPHRALRLMKSFAPGYLSWPVESAPLEFWKLLYPMPYRSAIETYSKREGIDPFLMAGLIRQESEFNPDAVSVAKAYGLTQIMPATGRALLKASRRRFQPSVLFRPELNLRLGTTHLRQVRDRYDAKWEMALAAYNAGASRVTNWSGWADYREPAEFIETIPFSETRGYVFAVLRNAQMYRRLYSGTARPPATVKKAVAAKPTPAAKKRRRSAR
jgi:soluble lytic murein transglycosylase